MTLVNSMQLTKIFLMLNMVSISRKISIHVGMVRAVIQVSKWYLCLTSRIAMSFTFCVSVMARLANGCLYFRAVDAEARRENIAGC